MTKFRRPGNLALISAIDALESRTLLAAVHSMAAGSAARDLFPTLTPTPAPITLNIWPTYTQATADLQTIASTYPSLTHLMSIGTTVQGRTIWAMELTEDPGVAEDKPQFYYQGQIHGDEPIGMENSFQLMSELLTNYGGSSAYQQRLTNLVNNMDLWIVPSMNWDGYTASQPYPSSVAQRENANGVDLNRNFPEYTTRSFSSDTKYFGAYGNVYDGPAPQTALLQPETVAMMNFLKSHDFVASANFHSGDLVVNYPWDSDGSTGANHAYAPDDALFKAISLVYSTQNAPMYANNARESGSAEAFVHGTTDGDAWYPVSGGEQDWANVYTGDHQVTIELDNVHKYPAATDLPTLWTNNRESMLQFMEAANWGVRGLVTDASSGAPLYAKVTVTTAPPHTPDPNHPSTFRVYTDPLVGDYHRQLLPGTYAIKYEAVGYITQTINVTVTSQTNDPTLTLRQDVHLVHLDVTPPTVTAGTFTYNGSPQNISFNFSEQVQGVDNTDLILHDNSSNTNIASSNITLANYNSTNHIATFTFNYSGGTLPSGNYTASLNSAGITDTSNNQLVGGYSYNFIYIDGSAGADTIYAKRSGANLQVWLNANPGTDPATYTAAYSTLSNFDVDGNSGNNTLSLDFTAGEVRPAGAAGFGYRLGTDSEILQLIGPINWAFNTDPQLDVNQPNLSLVLNGGATASFSAAVTHLVGLDVETSSSASLLAGAGRVLVLNSITLGGGTLDLNDNDMIVDYTDGTQLSTVAAAVRNARDGGLWDHAGITSTFAKNASPKITTLGAIEASDYKTIYGPSATFDGQPIDNSAVLVKYTYYGDSNFNGKVDGSDYARVDNLFAQQATAGLTGGWINGDFDFNSQIDGSDYGLMDSAFASQGNVIL